MRAPGSGNSRPVGAVKQVEGRNRAARMAVDRSLAAGPNASMKVALQDARGTISACVAVTGLVVPESTIGAAGKPRGRKRKSAAA